MNENKKKKKRHRNRNDIKKKLNRYCESVFLIRLCLQIHSFFEQKLKIKYDKYLLKSI